MTPHSDSDPEIETMEAPGGSVMVDPPVTVPLPEIGLRTPHSKTESILRLRRDEPNEVYTPAIRVPVRAQARAARASIHANNRLLISPSRKANVHGPAQLPVGAEPKLRVLRGVHVNVEYPLFKGINFMGRRDDEPIDIDLENQEPSDRIWTSRKHAAIYFHNGVLEIEDLNSLNGTFVNRNRVAPGHRQQLHVNDVIQVGTIQLRVLA